MDEDALDAVTRHAEAIATLRAFAARSQAERVVLVADVEEGAAMIECDAGGSVALTDRGRTFELPAAAPVPGVPKLVPDVRPVPPTALAFDPDRGELEAPLGTVAALGRAVLALARAFGGRSVATADFATRRPGLALTIAAREGEPLVVAAGDHRFELPQEALGG